MTHTHIRVYCNNLFDMVLTVSNNTCMLVIGYVHIVLQINP